MVVTTFIRAALPAAFTALSTEAVGLQSTTTPGPEERDTEVFVAVPVQVPNVLPDFVKVTTTFTTPASPTPMLRESPVFTPMDEITRPEAPTLVGSWTGKE
jgi:hypothetical protein